jgi:hypothetical protein
MSQSNSSRMFRISCGAGGCFGPELRPMTAEEIGECSFLPGTQYLLLKLQQPASYRNDLIEYVLVSPRHTGTSLENLRAQGGVVAITRVLPNVSVDIGKEFKTEEVDYFAVGDCKPVEG